MLSGQISYLELFHHSWTHLDYFLPIGANLDQFGLMCTQLGLFGSIWKYLEQFEAI